MGDFSGGWQIFHMPTARLTAIVVTQPYGKPSTGFRASPIPALHSLDAFVGLASREEIEVCLWYSTQAADPEIRKNSLLVRKPKSDSWK
ncbi:hypothetical protein [Brasilonema bromeliae]|uniref:Uncharacterized protein n=1 Tax=Brasilonema bromeliae SPC951 TaxID=385972 RepID=A0ABX1P757_9CYAN|nr:hypothetical protein [Brasilonema bromeliae SPC951]